MSEQLGEAVLALRTDDSAFTAGVNKAEAAAKGLGKTLDMASGSAVELAGAITEAANSGNRGAQAWLKAGNAIEQLAVAQAQAKVETDNAKASLNAGTISLEQYNRQILETKSGLALFEEEHRKAQAELRETIALQKQGTSATGAQKAGLMQLTQQLGDMSTMYSLGMRPQQIFASQIGQVTGAVQMLAGEGSKFARFLGGPWGLAISTAVMVLGPFIGNLLSTEDAMQKVEMASDGLSDAQGVLGRMFDLTTGKIKEQTAQLRFNAEAMALNLRAEAERQGNSSRGVLDSAAKGDFSKIGAIKMGLRWASGDEVRKTNLRIEQLQGWVRQYRDGTLSAEQVAQLASTMSFEGLSTSREEFIQALSDDISAKGKRATADAIDRSLATNVLDPSLRQPGTPKKTRKNKQGKSEADIDAEYLRDLSSLDQDELQAKLALATDASDRLEIQRQLLDAERADKIEAIERNKDFSAKQKAAQIAVINRLYGKPGTTTEGGIVVDGPPGLLSTKLMRDFEAEQTRLANDLLSRQAEALQAQAQVAPTLKERARLEAEALKLQQQIQTNLLEQAIATGQVADAEKARAALKAQQEAQNQQQAERSAGPLDSYVRNLRNDQLDTRTRVEQLMVQELDYVHHSISDSISRRLGVKDPFLKGLIDMFVQDVLIKPFAEALQSARNGGGNGGLFGSLLGGLFGSASPQSSLLSSAQATISDPQFAGLFAGGGEMPLGSWGIVGEAGPEPVFATSRGVGVLPNSALRQMGTGGGGAPYFDLRGAVMTEDLLRQMNSIAGATVKSGLSAYDTVVGDRVKEQLGRRGS